MKTMATTEAPAAPVNIFIIGYGDIGRRVAAIYLEDKYTVSGLARSTSSAQQMRDDAVKGITADLDDKSSLKNLSMTNSLIFYFAPPPPAGLTDPRMENFLSSMGNNNLPLKIIYISTSGVYGDQAGGWVTETSPTRPGAERSHRRLDAENQLRNFTQQYPVELVILRVGGIYGPGRIPEKRIRDQIPVIHEALAPKTNRIHADDLAEICIAAAKYGRDGEIYNVSDGCDSNMTEYFFQVADHLGIARPPSIGWETAKNVLSPGMLSYLRESRRMNNSKMLKELRIRLKYPNLISGLKNISL
ncbi:MAG: SDR family oxidoreductase [Gammaproteobacteria bacterium]|nr:SDR family oxidoreductase [Gammaproteobacteria bacterium]MDX2488425.1 SDR family oxidoreductase [Gammaproteobacteria bacterium]